MFEEIKKPKILKNVPSLLIRVLPPIYYYLQYVNQGSPKTPYPLFNSSLTYLKKCLSEIGDKTGVADFSELATQTDMFLEQNHDSLAPCFNEFVERLSLLCKSNHQEIKLFMREHRSPLKDAYLKSVKKLSVLLIDNKPKSEISVELAKKLENFCHYNVAVGSPNSLSFSTDVVSCDFGIFTSTASARIHDEVKR